MKFSINYHHDISYGHRVYSHESKCAHLHGHNARIHFTITARPEIEALDELGRVIDFSVIRKTLCEWLEENWDHKFLIYQEDPFSLQLAKLDPLGVRMVPFNPTAENMAAYLIEAIGPVCLEGTGCIVTKVKVEETRKCSATCEL